MKELKSISFYLSKLNKKELLSCRQIHDRFSRTEIIQKLIGYVCYDKWKASWDQCKMLLQKYDFNFCPRKRKYVQIKSCYFIHMIIQKIRILHSFYNILQNVTAYIKFLRFCIKAKYANLLFKNKTRRQNDNTFYVFNLLKFLLKYYDKFVKKCVHYQKHILNGYFY